MNKETELSRVARAVVIVAALGQIVAVAAQLVVGLVADPVDQESAMKVDLVIKIFNLAAHVLLVLGLFVIARAFRSRLWLVCFVLFILRALFGVVEVISRLGVQVEGEGMQKLLMVCYVLFVLAAWVVMGITLIIRRFDAEVGLGMTTGITILVSMGLWVYVFMSFFGIVPFSFFFAEVAGAVSSAASLVLSCLLFSIAVGLGRSVGVLGGRLLLRLGAVGSVLLVTSMALIWKQAVGGRSFGDTIFFAFAVMGWLGLLGAGLGYLGQMLASGRRYGLVAAVLVWVQMVFFTLSIIWARSIELILITGLLTLAALVAGGISFISSRKLAAPAVAVATGVVLLVIATISLVLLVFLGKSGFDLPWTVRNVLIAVVQAGMMAAFTMATVHHLAVAGQGK